MAPTQGCGPPEEDVAASQKEVWAIMIFIPSAWRDREYGQGSQASIKKGKQVNRFIPDNFTAADTHHFLEVYLYDGLKIIINLGLKPHGFTVKGIKESGSESVRNIEGNLIVTR